MLRKHHSSSSLIKLMKCQKGIGHDDIQIADSRPTFMPYKSNGTYATNRHARRMLHKPHSIQAKRTCDLKGGQEWLDSIT